MTLGAYLTLQIRDGRRGEIGMVIYDKTNNQHSAWYSGLYDVARQFIGHFLLSQPARRATTIQIRSAFKSIYPGRLREEIIRSRGNKQPKWQHCIDNALQNMKNQRVVGYDRARRECHLINETLSTNHNYEVIPAISGGSRERAFSGGLPSLGKRR